MTYDDVPIGEFLDAIASERVAPAGGTTAAVAGAIGAALCEMVCTHTLAAETQNRAGSGAAASDAVGGDGQSLSELRAGLHRRREALLSLADRDAAVVEELFGADGASSTRLERRAAGVPLSVAEASLGVLTDAEVVFARGRSGVAADAKTGAYLADAAVRASVETVRIDVAALSGESFAAEIDDRAAAVAESAAMVRGRLFDSEERA